MEEDKEQHTCFLQKRSEKMAYKAGCYLESTHGYLAYTCKGAVTKKSMIYQYEALMQMYIWMQWQSIGAGQAQEEPEGCLYVSHHILQPLLQMWNGDHDFRPVVTRN